MGEPNPTTASAASEERNANAGDHRAGFWSSLRATAGLVFPLGEAGRGAGVAGACRTHWIVPMGLVVGIGYACLYRGAWRFFGEVQGIRLMPAVAVWLLDVGLCGSVLLVGSARVADQIFGGRSRRPGGEPTVEGRLGLVGMASFVVLCVLKLMLWISIPEGVSTWPGIWGSGLNFAYPHAFYRPLLLAPIWGRWGLVLAAGLGRPSAEADAVIRGLTSRQSPYGVLIWFVPVAALTAVYCGYSGRWAYGCVIALGVMGATYLFGVAVARRLGGQTRETILAAGLVAEMSYLVLYMGFSVRIYSG
ncbi:MAG: hypothetical protein JSV19_06075 [Phycisphaerales bacterium]|nr:MAG: hypothetical protein JSV19_06075 [Phycisphaerales bacterium]